MPEVLNVIKQINPANGCVVVAHPDDEVCWFGGLILSTAHIKWHIVCCSYPVIPGEIKRKEDFFKACKHAKLSHEMMDIAEPRTRDKMDRIESLRKLNLSKYDIVLTHGNFGHLHHRCIGSQIRELYNGPIIGTNYGRGDFVTQFGKSLYARKLEWMKNYKANRVKVNGRLVEKWEALLHYYPILQKDIERFEIFNTEKTLNTYNRSWKLTPGVNCDIELVQYLKDRKASGKTIFHFGTGEHHKVGHLAMNNIVLGITASPIEYDAYIKMAINDPALATRYKVLFGDIYTMNPGLLPQFDIITMFHLCEYCREDSNYGQMTDHELLGLFIDKLKLGGIICFFVGSNHYREAKAIIEDYERQGLIQYLENYHSIVIYGKL